MRAALVASAFRGALPPVDLRAVCFVRAILGGDARESSDAKELKSSFEFSNLCFKERKTTLD